MNQIDNVLMYLEDACRRFPDKIAIRLNEQCLTFAELASLSQRLAFVIISRGLTGQPLAVLAERSLEVPVLFFAALYSGNYYVPLDPEMPEHKMRSILDELSVPLLLAAHHDSIANEVFKQAANLLTLDDITLEDVQLQLLPGGASPLYVVYTSGSTGKPKGVRKSHAAEISFIEAYCHTFSFSEQDVIGNQTPFYFDASGKDIYLMLKTGATLDIIPHDLFMRPLDLIASLNAHQVTFISWVPSALVIVSKLKTFAKACPTTLRKVFFVGEVMPVKHLRPWLEALPQVQFVNLYGSSEIAGIACWHEVTLENLPEDDLPIGRPLENCHVVLLADGKVVTEPGVTGEIVIASDALALDYIHDPEKTASVFPRLELDGTSPVRCLKTGDLAQYTPTGELTFVSRNDFQIKHLGHRIELGEIEWNAERIDHVQRTCCIYDRDKDRIVLFCEREKGSELDRQTIMSALKHTLSSYMLPNKLIIVDELPLNANGKLDRQRLKEQVINS